MWPVIFIRISPEDPAAGCARPRHAPPGVRQAACARLRARGVGVLGRRGPPERGAGHLDTAAPLPGGLILRSWESLRSPDAPEGEPDPANRQARLSAGDQACVRRVGN